MKLKMLVLIIAVILLTVNGLTHNKMFLFMFYILKKIYLFCKGIVSLHKSVIIGKFLCYVGGFIGNPFTKIGDHYVPLILTTDDIIIGSAISGFLIWHFLKNKFNKLWKLILVMLILVIVFAYLYRMIGVIMIYFAETRYGMSGCAEGISLPHGIKIEYSWYSPLFMIGFVFALISLVGIIFKMRNRIKGEGNA